MDDLVTWLRAQMDDDERMAREAVTGPWHFDGNPSCVVVAADGRSLSASAWNCEPPTNAANATHIARWDPARVLAEIDAKRRILDEHPDDGEGFCGDGVGLVGCKWAYPCPTVRLLAQPYAGRDGYRDKWRPEAVGA